MMEIYAKFDLYLMCIYDDKWVVFNNVYRVNNDGYTNGCPIWGFNRII